jgi:hypothetical protein
MGVESVAIMKFVEIAVDLSKDPKVRKMAMSAWHGLYDGIFNKKTDTLNAQGAQPQIITERQMIVQLLDSQATSLEMSVAFSTLQAELRRGQQLMWIGICGFGSVNLLLLVYMISR